MNEKRADWSITFLLFLLAQIYLLLVSRMTWDTLQSNTSSSIRIDYISYAHVSPYFHLFTTEKVLLSRTYSSIVFTILKRFLKDAYR